MKNLLEVIKFNEEFPEEAINDRICYECHCGSAWATELRQGVRTVIFGEKCKHEQKGIVKLYPIQHEGYECNNKLLGLLRSLRKNQKAFFAAKQGSNERLVALTESKLLERELDKFLHERYEQSSPAQPDLFNS